MESTELGVRVSTVAGELLATSRTPRRAPPVKRMERRPHRLGAGRCLSTGAKSHNALMDVLKTFGLFALTAVAEIVGCYLPYLWLKQDKSAWLLLPAGLSLAVFAWLLTLHPAAAGRVYAAYGGVYIGVAILWLWAVDGIRPTSTDWIGVAVSLAGMAIIMFGPRPAQ
jgi:small multidrug resistance family-3 protein